MKKIYTYIILLLFVSGACNPPEPRDYIKTETQQEKDARMQWWRDARFGMFIHWGLYAVPAGQYGEETNHAEWIQETADIPVEEYEKYAEQFNPVQFNAREWVKIAKDAGMKYIVITSKHHDGFCLWDSEVTDYDIIDRTPYKKDVLKELAEACKDEGIKFCFYHSIMDWHHPHAQGINHPNYNYGEGPNPDFSKYVEEYMKPQLVELVNNYGDIGVLWFDGEWINEWTEEQGKELYNYLRNMKPDLIINNRVGKGRQGMAGMNAYEDAAGDFGTPEQEILHGTADMDWESCMTMNGKWGYNKFDHNWKSAEMLIHNHVDIAAKGGNYLLNVGPTAEGLIPQKSIDRLKDMGKWLDINGEAVYKTVRAPHYKEGKELRFTAAKDDETLYAIALAWPGSQLDLRYYKADKNTEVELLGYDKSLNWHNDPAKGLIIEIPDELQNEKKRPCQYAYVFKFKGTANKVTGTPDILTDNKTNPDKLLFTQSILIELKGNDPEEAIYYTLDGKEPSVNSKQYTEPIEIEESCVLKIFSVKEGQVNSPVRSVTIKKTTGASNVSLTHQPSPKYAAHGALSLVDKERGSEQFGDGNWLGFEGNDFEVVIDLGKLKRISRVEVGFLHQAGSWIFFPVKTKISISRDGNNYTEKATLETPLDKNRENTIMDLGFKINAKTRYIKINAENIGVCPEWHAGAGGKAWLFVDEVIIN